ncbi:hypothetical protein SCARR_03044 [Pontiella sulfatireligans]|uniref:Uncharacterized protein n=2 Tax=Pontiella sulfatireligans TaxID=2750658 RepID=A0A6C2UPP2_9BACT|nr:hypothetical protein SCARR_03044 [Pontiella sulfatireligans]
MCLLDGLPYTYFQILRWAVCGVCGYRAYLSYTLEEKAWMWGFIFAGVLFNPISPIRLDRDVWAVVDVCLAVLLLLSLKAIRNGGRYMLEKSLKLQLVINSDKQKTKEASK